MRSRQRKSGFTRPRSQTASSTKETYEEQKQAVRWEPPKPEQTWPNQPNQQGGDELRSYLDRLG
jgi:hypothetical protein